MNKPIAYAAILGAAASLIVSLPADAGACSPAVTPMFDVVPDPTETSPPPTPVLRISYIERGQARDSGGCGGTDDAQCLADHVGTTEVEVVEPAGDLTGFVLDRADFPFEVLTDNLFGINGRTFGGSHNGQFWIRFDDGATDDQELFSFTFSVRAIDHAGNVSIEPAILTVNDPGSGGGCTAAAGATPWALVIGMLLADRSLRARRRSAQPIGNDHSATAEQGASRSCTSMRPTYSTKNSTDSFRGSEALR